MAEDISSDFGKRAELVSFAIYLGTGKSESVDKGVMSCFSGKMVEYPQFSIDRFDEKNVEAGAFFLSHCHAGNVRLPRLSFSVRAFLYSPTFKPRSTVNTIVSLQITWWDWIRRNFEPKSTRSKYLCSGV